MLIWSSNNKAQTLRARPCESHTLDIGRKIPRLNALHAKQTYSSGNGIHNCEDNFRQLSACSQRILIDSTLIYSNLFRSNGLSEFWYRI